MSGKNIFKFLVLADKYQAEDVLNHCLNRDQNFAWQRNPNYTLRYQV